MDMIGRVWRLMGALVSGLAWLQGCDTPVVEATEDVRGDSDDVNAPEVAECDPARPLEVVVVVDGPSFPAESVSFEVRYANDVGDVAIRFEGGTDASRTRPVWVEDPLLQADGKYAVTMEEAAQLDWLVTVSDACTEAATTFSLFAGFPRVSFVHAAADAGAAGAVAFGGPSGASRLALTVVELDGDGAAVARDTAVLKFGEASSGLTWRNRTARFGVFAEEETEAFGTVQPEALMPLRDYAVVLHDSEEGPTLTWVALPDIEAEASSLLLNGLMWADALTLAADEGVLADGVLRGLQSEPFAMDWTTPAVGMATGTSGLDYVMVLADAVAFPASPDGGAAVDAGRFVKPSDRALWIAHTAADGDAGLLLVGFETAGGAFPLQMQPLAQLPRVSDAAVLLVNMLDSAAQLRDDIGRPVGPVVSAGAGAAAFARVGRDASELVLGNGENEHALPEDMMTTAAGSRHLVTAWPTGEGGVSMHVCRPTGAGAPVSAGRLDAVIASAQVGTVGVGLGVNGLGGFPVQGGTVSIASVVDTDLWIATFTSMGERRLLTVSPQAAFGGVEGRMVVLLPPGDFGREPVVALLRGGIAGSGFELASPVPFAWTLPYAIDVTAGTGGASIRTAAPFPSATGWVGYGPNESGTSGPSYRSLRLTGAPFFEVVLSVDVGTSGNGCDDSLVVRREVGNNAFEAVELDDAPCGRDVQRTLVVPEGTITVGVASNRVGHTNDEREGGPWAGWRVSAVTPRFEP